MKFRTLATIHVFLVATTLLTPIIADQAEVKKELDQRRNLIGWNDGPEKWREIVIWLESCDPQFVDQRWSRECKEWVSDLEMRKVKDGDIDGYIHVAQKMREYGGDLLYKRVLTRSLNRNPTSWRLTERLLDEDTRDMERILSVYFNAVDRKSKKETDVGAFLKLAEWCEINKNSNNPLESWSKKCYTKAAEIKISAARRNGGGQYSSGQIEFVEKTLHDLGLIINKPVVTIRTPSTEVPEFLPKLNYRDLVSSEFNEDFKYRVVLDGSVSFLPYLPIRDHGYDEAWERVLRTEMAKNFGEGSRSRSTFSDKSRPRNWVWRQLKWNSKNKKWVNYTPEERTEAHNKKIDFVKKIIRDTRKRVQSINQIRNERLDFQTRELEILKQWVEMAIVPGRLISEKQKELFNNAHAINELIQAKKAAEIRYNAWKQKLTELEYETS